MFDFHDRNKNQTRIHPRTKDLERIRISPNILHQRGPLLQKNSQKFFYTDIQPDHPPLAIYQTGDRADLWNSDC